MGVNITSNQNCLIQADKFFDYIPVVSTVTNVIDLIAKTALGVLTCCFASIGETEYGKYLRQKSVVECICLSIPIFNILVALARGGPKIVEKEPSQVKQAFEELQNSIANSQKTFKQAMSVASPKEASLSAESKEWGKDVGEIAGTILDLTLSVRGELQEKSLDEIKSEDKLGKVIESFVQAYDILYQQKDAAIREVSGNKICFEKLGKYLGELLALAYPVEIPSFLNESNLSHKTLLSERDSYLASQETGNSNC